MVLIFTGKTLPTFFLLNNNVSMNFCAFEVVGRGAGWWREEKSMDKVRHKDKRDKSYRQILFGCPDVSPNIDCLMLKYP